MRKDLAIMSLLWSSLISKLELFELCTENVAVAVGQTSTVICQSNSSDDISHLSFTPLFSTKELTIWSSEIGADPRNFTDPFVVFKDHFNVKLYLNSTNLSSAGTFTWKGMFASGDAHLVNKSIAQLIVLDGNATCNANIRKFVLQELESVKMQCKIGYRGNWAPVMEWRFSGNDDQLVRNGEQTVYVSNISVTSVFNFTVYYTMNNRQVNCRTFFGSYTGNVRTTATNVPDYSYTWTSPLLNITYGPKNLTITPVMEYYKPGDRLTCASDANPTPNYEWKATETFSIFTTGPTFTIASNSVSAYRVECTARNSVGSKSTSIEIKLSSGLDPQMYLLISLGILCFLLLLLIVLISGNQITDRCRILCAQKNRQRITLNTETNSNGPFQETQLTDLHVSATLYATVNKKVKKKKKVESDIMTTMNQQLTYIGADGTEYLEMGNFGSHPAGFTHRDTVTAHREKHQPPMRPSPYEPVEYASIDHNLSALPRKRDQD